MNNEDLKRMLGQLTEERSDYVTAPEFTESQGMEEEAQEVAGIEEQNTPSAMASTASINEDSKSPYQKTPEELKTDKIEQESEKYTLAQLLKDQEISRKEAKKDYDKKKKKLTSDWDKKIEQEKEAESNRAFYANLVKALGSIGAADIQRSSGASAGLKPFEAIAARDTTKGMRDAKKSELKDLMQEYKLASKGSDIDPYKMMQMQYFQDKMAESKARREDTRSRHDERMQEKRDKKLDKEVQDLSDKLDKRNILTKVNTMSQIDDYLQNVGFDLEDSSIEDAPDIPGMGFLGGFRPDMLTGSEHIQFRQKVQALANDLLKDLSGAAVSDQEYRRFLRSVGSGNFSTEKDLVSGLKKMQEDIRNRTTNAVKAGGEDVYQEYKDRTGINIDDYARPSKQLSGKGDKKRKEGDTWTEGDFMYRVKNGRIQKKRK
jgi:hypothetical protein